MDSCSLATRITSVQLRQVYHKLMALYGPQHWWPANAPFEVMVGAVLTQNTAWTHVERAIARLKRNLPYYPIPERGSGGEVSPFEKEGMGVSAEAILALPLDQLAECLRPVGYFNVKAQRLRSFCGWYVEQGGYAGLAGRDTGSLRQALLAVSGVGPETVDDILLYAFRRPVFVIDAYTRRLFARLGLIQGDEDYEVLRAQFERALGLDTRLFNEYHALIVRHGKEVCRKAPRCRDCCLAATCAFAGGT